MKRGKAATQQPWKDGRKQKYSVAIIIKAGTWTHGMCEEWGDIFFFVLNVQRMYMKDMSLWVCDRIIGGIYTVQSSGDM